MRTEPPHDHTRRRSKAMSYSALVLIFPGDHLGGEQVACMSIDVQAARSAPGGEAVRIEIDAFDETAFPPDRLLDLRMSALQRRLLARSGRRNGRDAGNPAEQLRRGHLGFFGQIVEPEPDALHFLRLMATIPELQGEVRRLAGMESDIDPEFARDLTHAFQTYQRLSERKP